MDMNKLMDMANQLRDHLAVSQEKAATMRVTGEAGAGLVRVVMNGMYEVVELKIDRKALDPSMNANDVSLLEDLVRAAVNQASLRVAETLKQGLGAMASNLGIDASAFDFLNKPK